MREIKQEPKEKEAESEGFFFYIVAISKQLIQSTH